MAFEPDSKSLHGKLLGTLIEHWSLESLFEQNDDVIRRSLEALISSKLPTIEFKVEWDMTPELIEKSMVVGDIFFKDEKGIARVLKFHVLATSAKIQENEEN